MFVALPLSSMFFSLQGYLEIHPRLYDVVIKLFNEKNIPLAKTLAELWKNKRLNHALCASPVNDVFMNTLSKHQSQLCTSSEFWSMCVEELKPLVVGFHHINNEIKQAASDLISNVSSSSKLMSIQFLHLNLKNIVSPVISSNFLVGSSNQLFNLSFVKSLLRLVWKTDFKWTND